jgi:hypothetical protein
VVVVVRGGGGAGGAGGAGAGDTPPPISCIVATFALDIMLLSKVSILRAGR